MNYSKIYADFIADRRAREAQLLASGVYVERHHVVPRSLNGGDEAENIVALTAGDHFFAHLCLAKIHGGWQWRSVWTMSDMAASVHKRSELFNRRRWVSVAREKTRELKAANARRLHQDPEWSALVHNAEVNAKRSATMRAHFASEAGAAHKKNWHGALHLAEAIEKRTVKCRENWDNGTYDHIKEMKSKQFRKNNPMKDPAVVAKRKGKGHGRSRSVKNTETGVTFETIGSAAASINVCEASLRQALKESRKCKGVLFAYL